MRKRAEQFGSGQAISVSVVIQSKGEVSRCLLGKSGNSAAKEYMENDVTPWSNFRFSPST